MAAIAACAAACSPTYSGGTWNWTTPSLADILAEDWAVTAGEGSCMDGTAALWTRRLLLALEKDVPPCTGLRDALEAAVEEDKCTGRK